MSIPGKGQSINKGTDIDFRNNPSIFRADFNRSLIGDYLLSPISGDMIVGAVLQSI